MSVGDVVLSAEPWLPGMRTVWSSWGSMHLRRVVSGVSWEEGIAAIQEDAADEARRGNANAVLGIVIECDPYRCELTLTGTAALLEPMFDGYVPVAP